MAIALDPQALIKAAVTAKSSTLTVASQPTLKSPLSSAGTQFAALGVNATIPVSSSLASGTTRVGYNRLVLSTVNSGLPLKVMVPDGVDTVKKLIPYLVAQYRWAADASEFVDTSIVYNAGVATVTLTAMDSSIGFAGSTTVKVVVKELLSGLTMNAALGDALYPSPTLTKGQAAVLAYQFDTSSYGAFLNALVAGQAMDAELVTLLTNITQLTWQLAAGAYSLSGASIDYNGVVPADYPTKSGYSKVVAITLGSDCTNFAGTMYFHYNSN